jgi:hypothetical protein
MKAMSKKLPIVFVSWMDASHGPMGWSFKNEATFSCMKCISVGFLVKNKKKSISIVPHCNGDMVNTPQIAGVMNIPKGMILEMYELKNFKKLKP